MRKFVGIWCETEIDSPTEEPSPPAFEVRPQPMSSNDFVFTHMTTLTLREGVTALVLGGPVCLRIYDAMTLDSHMAEHSRTDETKEYHQLDLMSKV